MYAMLSGLLLAPLSTYLGASLAITQLCRKSLCASIASHELRATWLVRELPHLPPPNTHLMASAADS